MNNANAGASLGEAATLMANLFGHSAQIGMRILGAMSAAPSKLFCEVVQGRRSLSAIVCCDTCEIPTPCWEPQPLGEVTSFVAPGGQATVRFRILNNSWSPRVINFAASGPPGLVTFSQNPVTLGPMERRVMSASLQFAASLKQGAQEEILVLVHGCRNYFLRWTVKVMNCGADMCNEVEVDDGPDLIHHWYDHFYCLRGCQEQRTHG